MEVTRNSAVKIIAGVALSASLLTLPACGQSEQLSLSSSSEASTQKAALQQIGASSATSKSFDIKNATGKEINGFLVGAAGALNGATAASVLPAWKAEDTAQVNYEPVAGAAVYDILVVCADGSSYMLHDVDPSLLKSDAQLKVDGSLAYISYTVDGKTVDTLAAEQAKSQESAALAQAQAELQAEQERIAAEEAQAAQELAVVEPYPESYGDFSSDDSGYSNGGDSSQSAGVDSTYSNDSGAAADTSANVGQSADGCVAGGVILR